MPRLPSLLRCFSRPRSLRRVAQSGASARCRASLQGCRGRGLGSPRLHWGRARAQQAKICKGKSCKRGPPGRDGGSPRGIAPAPCAVPGRCPPAWPGEPLLHRVLCTPRFSALHHAALNGNTELISLLLEAQAAVDIKDNKGESEAGASVQPRGPGACSSSWGARPRLGCECLPGHRGQWS